jgi:hypothetical protein
MEAHTRARFKHGCRGGGAPGKEDGATSYKGNGLNDTQKKTPDNPMDHPEEQPAGTDAPFKLGRLLLLLAIAVALIGLIAIASEAYFA